MLDDSVFSLLREAKKLAKSYRALTGRPLGITGEVAEYEAARLLGVTLAAARQAGYDATELHQGELRRLQIKGRCLPKNAKSGQQVGSINMDKEWDSVLLVLLDDEFEAYEIHEAERSTVIAALTMPGSKARNERNALSVGKFKAVGKLRWSLRGGLP